MARPKKNTEEKPKDAATTKAAAATTTAAAATAAGGDGATLQIDVASFVRTRDTVSISIPSFVFLFFLFLSLSLSLSLLPFLHIPCLNSFRTLKSHSLNRLISPFLSHPPPLPSIAIPSTCHTSHQISINHHPTTTTPTIQYIFESYKLQYRLWTRLYCA